MSNAVAAPPITADQNLELNSMTESNLPYFKGLQENESSSFHRPSLVDKIRQLPKPSQFFQGYNGMFSMMPKDIVIFTNPKYFQRALENQDRFVMAICVSGTGTVKINEESYQVSPGWGTMAFPYQCHTYNDMNDSLDWMFISFELNSDKELSVLRDLPFKFDEEHFKIIEKMLASYSIEGDLNSESQKLVLLLTELLFKTVKSSANSETSLGEQNSIQPLSSRKQTVNEIISYINDHIGEGIQVQDVAEYIHKSDSYVRKLVREVAGITVGKLIQKTQLQKSCNLLKYTDKTLTEISEDCGFLSIYSFSRAFSRQMQSSPMKYRNNFLANN